MTRRNCMQKRRRNGRKISISRPDDLSTEHITWLVESRSRNQHVCLKLFLVLKDNEKQIKNKSEHENNAQALVAIAFSLWRAVFLSDVEIESATVVLAAAQSFLGNLILHNTVAYQHDRTTRDWAFIYYVNNARYRLESISRELPNIVPVAFVADEQGDQKSYWSFCQAALETAVRNFEHMLHAPN